MEDTGQKTLLYFGPAFSWGWNLFYGRLRITYELLKKEVESSTWAKEIDSFPLAISFKNMVFVVIDGDYI